VPRSRPSGRLAPDSPHRHRWHPRRHRLPQDPARPRPHDQGPLRSRPRPAQGTETQARPELASDTSGRTVTLSDLLRGPVSRGTPSGVRWTGSPHSPNLGRPHTRPLIRCLAVSITTPPMRVARPCNLRQHRISRRPLRRPPEGCRLRAGQCELLHRSVGPIRSSATDSE